MVQNLYSSTKSKIRNPQFLCLQLFQEQVQHSAALCLNQDLEKGLEMNLQLGHWFFLNAIQGISFMDQQQLDVIQYQMRWHSGMILSLHVLVSSSGFLIGLIAA